MHSLLTAVTEFQNAPEGSTVGGKPAAVRSPLAVPPDLLCGLVISCKAKLTGGLVQTHWLGLAVINTYVPAEFQLNDGPSPPSLAPSHPPPSTYMHVCALHCDYNASVPQKGTHTQFFAFSCFVGETKVLFVINLKADVKNGDNLSEYNSRLTKKSC